MARLTPRDVDRATGQIVTKKSETIDVRPASAANGLRPIDPQTDLVAGTTIAGAAMAFEFVDDWTLPLTATRYELENLKRTSIPRAVVRVVALRQNELSVQALYQIRSVDQRLAIKMPNGFDTATSFDDQPIRVNGNRVTPERGGEGLIYVPLTEQSANQTFLLELRYTIAGDHRQIDLPEFPENPAVQKAFLCVYLPYEQALLSKSGPWTDEAVDVDSALMSRLFTRRNDNVNNYLNWVSDGIEQVGDTNQTFETDGRPFVFSTLRPLPAPEGSLSLRTINQTLLNGMVCGLMALIGLLLIRCRVATQLAGFVLVVGLMVAVAIFFPLMTEHLFASTFWLSWGVVAAVWLVADLGRWGRSYAIARHQRREANAASPTNETPRPAESVMVISDDAAGATSSNSPPKGESPRTESGDSNPNDANESTDS